MDLKNLEGTSTYAIEAVYREYWNLIPEKYKLQEQAQRQHNGNFDEYGNFDSNFYNNLPEHKKQKVTTVTPLSYADVEKKEDPIEVKEYSKVDLEYDKYVEDLRPDKQYFDVTPFYDPELNFENRLHMHLANIDFPTRKNPWFIITWNCGNGLLNSSLTRRRFDTTTIETPAGKKVKFNFINTDMDLTFAIYSNTMQGLFELQENIIVGKREKAVVNTAKHSILGSFPVSLDIINSNLSKLPKDKGTLCCMMLNIKIDFPVIGNVQEVSTGIIKEIHSEIDKIGSDPQDVYVYSRDIITETTEN